MKLKQALIALAANEVRFVIVGGVAANLQGSAFTTLDLDICYGRDSVNLDRIVAAFAPFHPRLRGAPPEVRLIWDRTTLRNGLNFALSTDLGDLDLLAEVAGVGDYEQARAASIELEVHECRFAILRLDKLIASKRAAGRPKDLLTLPELEALWEATRPR